MEGRFLERLRTGPAIVADGGMGALVSAAVPRLRTPEEANLRAPEAVVSLHVGFINAAAAKLAREAREMAGREVFIAGSIGPIGQPATSRVRQELFAEQATALE